MEEIIESDSEFFTDTAKTYTIKSGMTSTTMDNIVVTFTSYDKVNNRVMLSIAKTGSPPITQYFTVGAQYQYLVSSSTKYGVKVLGVDVSSGGTYVRVSIDNYITETNTHGAIRFETTPPGANVYIDNVLRPGKTPCTQSYIKVGVHAIKLVYNGMQFTADVTVREYNNNDNPVRVSHTFSNQPGSIYVVTSPGGAYVNIDGVRQSGTTPKVFSNIATGSRRVRVEMSGFVAQEQVVTVTSNQQANVAFAFKTVGSIVCSTTPTAADVYIDNVLQSVKTPATFTNIRYGSHTVEFRKTGYQSKKLTVSVPGGGSVTASATLVKAVTTTSLTIVPSVTTVTEGTQMKFTGTLKTTSGTAIANAKIYFWKDTTVDTQLKNSGTNISATTDQYGNYAVYWYADNSNLTTSQIHKIYAKYGGLTSGTSVVYNAVSSTPCSVTIKPKAAVATKTTIAVSPTSVAAGATVTFTGKVLTSANAAVPSVPVTFWTLTSAGQLGTQIKSGTTVIQSTTDSTGSFRATWQAVDLNGTSDNSALRIVAVFAGTPAYIKSQSSYINLTVSPGTGYIQCNSTPSGASVYIDDKLQTVKTPAKFSGLAVGTHKVEYRLTGYNNYINNYVVISAAGATATVTATLVKGVLNTAITLNSPGSSFFEGDKVTFSGFLKDSAGNPVPDVIVAIYKQNTSLIPDEQLKNGSTLVQARTTSAGYFSVGWTAVDMNTTTSQIHTIIAKFAGNTAYVKSQSRTYDITIKPKEAVATVLTLTSSTTETKVGGAVILSGTLKTIEGLPVSNATVTFWDDQYIFEGELKNNGVALKATTNSTGAYSVTWTAAIMESLLSSDTVKIYAKYAGHVLYKASHSTPTRDVKVNKNMVTPTLSLSVSPTTVEIGNNATLSGYLIDPSTNQGIANAKVSIYDKDDILNLTNDLITSVTTNTSGYYTYSWKATPEVWLNVTTSTVEMQAQFDGSTNYNKITSALKTVTVTDSRVPVNFTSIPNKASVDVDGKAATIYGVSVNETPMTIRVTEGTHTARFYFNSTNMPSGQNYAPLTIQFTAKKGVVNPPVVGQWETDNICNILGTMFGFSMSVEECRENMLVKIADFFLDISSFTRILFGKDIYGKPGTAGNGDYFAVVLTVFPFGKAIKVIKALKGLQVDSMGALISKAVMDHPELVSKLDSSLFFNRIISMDDAALTKLENMFKEIVSTPGGISAAKINALQEFIESFPFKAIPSTKLAKAQSELAKIFTDPNIKRSIDFLQRVLPTGAIAKEYTQIFNKFLAGNTIPTPTQLIDLANAGKTNPADILELLTSYRWTQLRYVQHKLEYLGGPNSEAAEMIGKFIDIDSSGAIADKATAIKNICTEYGPKISSSLRSYVSADVQQGIMKLTDSHENAIYNISERAGQKYVTAMKSIFPKYSESSYGKATVETIQAGTDIIIDAVKESPISSTIANAKTALLSADTVLDDVIGTVPTSVAKSEITDAMTINNIIEGCNPAITSATKSNVVDIYSKVAPTTASAKLNYYSLLKFITDELPTLVTNKGTRYTSYNSLNPNSLISKLHDILIKQPGNAIESFSTLLDDIENAIATLAKSGISPSRTDTLSDFGKYIFKTIDEIPTTTIPEGGIIPGVTETLESLLTKYADELRMFSDAEARIANGYVDLIMKSADDFTQIILSDGTTLASKKGFSKFEIFKRAMDEIADLGINERTGTNVRIIISDISRALRDEFLQLLDYGLDIKITPSDITGLTDDIIQKIDDVPLGPIEEITEEIIEETAEIVAKYTSFFDDILLGHTGIRITAGTITELIDHLIANPSDIYKIIDVSKANELISKLYGYGTEGKVLAELIRLLRQCKGFEVQIGREANFNAFMTATLKAARGLIASGKDPTLMRLWDVLFDSTNGLKPLDELMGTKSYAQLYSLVYTLGNSAPSTWFRHTLTWGYGKLTAVNKKRLMGTLTGMGSTGWSTKEKAVMFLLFGADSFYLIVSYATGNNPMQVQNRCNSYIIAIRSDLSELDNQCDFEKSAQFTELLTKTHTNLDNFKAYRAEHASFWTGDVGGLGEMVDSQIAVFDTLLKQADDCNAATGTGTTPSTGGSSDFTALQIEIGKRDAAVTSIFFSGQTNHSAGNTTEVARIAEVHKTEYDKFIGFLAQNWQTILANNYNGTTDAMGKAHYEHQKLLTAWATESPRALDTSTINQLVDDAKWGIINQSNTCSDLCDNGSSELPEAIELLEDLIEDAEDLLSQYSTEIGNLNRTKELQNTIDIAKGELELYNNCETSAAPVNGDLLSIIRDLQDRLSNTRWACYDFHKNGAVSSLAALLPSYADQLVELQSIINDRAPEVEALGLTAELQKDLAYYQSYYDYYSGQSSTGTPVEELPADSPLYEQLDSLFSDLNTFYWNCYNAKKRGDTTNFNSNLEVYEGLISELEGLQSSKATEIADIGYTSTVNKNLVDHRARLAGLKSTSSSGSTTNPSTPTTPTTPDDSDTTGGSYVNDSYNKAVTLIDKIDDNSSACWELCKAGAKAALTASLKTYTTNLNALKKLYAEHLPELKSASADSWVAGDIEYHTSDIAKLQNCATTSTEEPEEEEPVEEPETPDTTDMTDEEVIDTVDQMLDDMESIWDEAQNATVTEEVV